VRETIQVVGVVGAGAMGRGIAQVCAAAGNRVMLFDVSSESVLQAMDTIRIDLARAVSKGKMSSEDAASALLRIEPVDSVKRFRDCGLVVEAIIENLEVKQSLMRELESIVTHDCILATNTSSLSVSAIAAVCERPQRIAGWHFFNPVPRMKLVEIVHGPRTSKEAVDSLLELSQRIGHRAIVTADSPGFVVNHAGRAFVTEGLKLLAERTASHDILDATLRLAGFRMGPFELLDLTGLDVSVPVMESIHSQYYGDDRYRPTALARTRLVAGLLGRKTGEGFYSYRGEHPVAACAATATPAHPDPKIWWPTTGRCAVPATVTSLLAHSSRVADVGEADVILLAPLGSDLSTAVVELGLDARRSVGIDPLFSGTKGVTVMATAATSADTLSAATSLFASAEIPVYVIADSPGFVAPRVIACVVNLACEMAQQGLAKPAEIDTAVQLALGYPFGPFEWAEHLGPVRIVEILRGLFTTFGDPRYRPSPWLIRRAQLSLPLTTPDVCQQTTTCRNSEVPLVTRKLSHLT
jgi:3-hydroxybutyryl-CoA dehydrogenase